MPTFYHDDIACEEVNSETVKSILENMDSILKELDTELRSIHDAIYGERDDTKNEPPQSGECLLETLGRQREEAVMLLELTKHIRESLW